MSQTFTLEGQTYSQQYRKCGKANCQTCQDGAGHGPYWYRRDQLTGARSYVGRELPADVARARQELDRQRSELARQRDGLRQQAAALARLIGREHLSGRDRELIDWLGFGSCLVAMPAAAPMALHLVEAARLVRCVGWQSATSPEGACALRMTKSTFTATIWVWRPMGIRPYLINGVSLGLTA